MSGTTTKRYTVEDYQKLPEGDPRQLINGELIDMTPSPIFPHERIVAVLVAALHTHCVSRKLGVVATSPDLFLRADFVARADLVFVSNERASRIQREGVRGAPDLIVELLSPSTRRYDLRDKRDAYAQAGVIEAWYLDLEIENLSLYRFAENPRHPVRTFERGEVLASPLLPGFSPELGLLFDGTLLPAL